MVAASKTRLGEEEDIEDVKEVAESSVDENEQNF